MIIEEGITLGSGILISNPVIVPPGPVVQEPGILIVGGGGGGGSKGSNGSGGGGGAGGLIYISGFVPTSGTYAIVVGSGGSPDVGGYLNVPSTNPASPGTLSSAFGYTALGGGAGGSRGFSGTSLDGGSGGGACLGLPGQGLQPTSTSGGYGNPGGYNTPGNSNGTQSGQGGGGAGGPGTGGSNVPGEGGDGLEYGINGTMLYYAGGGGGGAQNTALGPRSYGLGGLGGGGDGGTHHAPGNNATFYGGAGGGAGHNYPSRSLSGGYGYQGVVMICYEDTYPEATSTTGSPTYTVANGFRLYEFTNSGSITF